MTQFLLAMIYKIAAMSVVRLVCDEPGAKLYFDIWRPSRVAVTYILVTGLEWR